MELVRREGTCISACFVEPTASLQGYRLPPMSLTLTSTSSVRSRDFTIHSALVDVASLSLSTDDVYEREDIVGVYATIVALGVTIILCAITAGLAFFNTFGAYSSWLYGPPMLYTLSLASGVCQKSRNRSIFNLIFQLSWGRCRLR